MKALVIVDMQNDLSSGRAMSVPEGDRVVELDRSRIARVSPWGAAPGVDSYSGFLDNGHRSSTGLGEFLKGQGVTDVYVCGLATDYCVRAAALDAANLGFKTHLLEDGCRGVELQPGDVQRAIHEMWEQEVIVI